MEISQYKKTALLLGASGLVGSQCLQQLLSHRAYGQVHTFGRRPLQVEHPRLKQHIIDFDKLADYGHLFRGNDLFSCLGTTMAKAGSKEAFYKVDFTYAYESARLAAENKVGQLLLVSSVGADVDYPFYYSQVKGELEEAVKKLPFWAIHIFQPSVLLGPRQETRVGEWLAGTLFKGIDRLTGGQVLGKYRPVEDNKLAAAMILAAQQLKEGVHLYTSDQIHELAERDAAFPVKKD